MTDWIENAIPFENGVPAKCLQFAPNSSAVATFYRYHNNTNNLLQPSCNANLFNRSHTIRCNEFIYNTDEVNLVNEVKYCFAFALKKIRSIVIVNFYISLVCNVKKMNGD